MALHVEIVTPSGAALEAEADEVVLPGVMGEIGILPSHLPLLSALRPGVLRLRHVGKTDLLAIGTGFVEVGAKDRIVVLVEECQRPEQVDLEDARRNLASLDDQLRSWNRETGAEFERATLDRSWAEARIRIAESRRN